MTTLAELERAFIAADDAGNTEDATAFAAEIERLQKEQTSAPQSPPTTAEKIVANPAIRLALGGLSPFYGAFEMIPGEAGKYWRANNAKLKEMVRRGELYYPEYVNTVGSISQFVGEGVPVAAAMKALPVAKTFAQLAGQGSVAGALSGLTSPTGATGDDRLAQGAIGTVLGGVATPVIGKITEGAKNVIGPIFSDKVAQHNAARMAAKVSDEYAGPNAAALRSAAPDDTAAQAAAGVGSAEFAALQSLVQGRRPTDYLNVSSAQEAARKAARQAVTPDEAAAIAARDAVSDVAYGKAYSVDRMRRGIGLSAGNTRPGPLGEPIAVTNQELPAITALKDNPVIQAAMRDAVSLIKSDSKYAGVPTDPTQSLEGLHLLKIAIDNRFKDPTAATALQNYSKAALVSTKRQLLGAIDEISPLYTRARELRADMSPPINQARILNEMDSILDKPTGGERVGPYLNVLGRGESALLKRTSGDPRYEKLSDALIPEQMSVVNLGADQMRRDAALKSAASAGMPKALEKLRVGEMKDVKAPSLVDAKYAFFNRILNMLEGAGGERTEGALSKMMLPKSAGGDPQKLGALMEMYLRRPQGWTESIVKSPLTQAYIANASSERN